MLLTRQWAIHLKFTAQNSNNNLKWIALHEFFRHRQHFMLIFQLKVFFIMFFEFYKIICFEKNNVPNIITSGLNKIIEPKSILFSLFDYNDIDGKEPIKLSLCWSIQNFDAFNQFIHNVKMSHKRDEHICNDPSKSNILWSWWTLLVYSRVFRSFLKVGYSLCNAKSM